MSNIVGYRIVDDGYRYTANYEGDCLFLEVSHIGQPDKLVIWARADHLSEPHHVNFKLYRDDEVTQFDGWIDVRGMMRVRANIEAASPPALTATSMALEKLHALVIVFRKAMGLTKGPITIEELEQASKTLTEHSRHVLAKLRADAGF